MVDYYILCYDYTYPVVLPCVLGRHFNACNVIDNHNKMFQYDLEIDKYWVAQRGYFRLATMVVLGEGITYGKFIFCNGISKQIRDKKFSKIY